MWQKVCKETPELREHLYWSNEEARQIASDISEYTASMLNAFKNRMGPNCHDDRGKFYMEGFLSMVAKILEKMSHPQAADFKVQPMARNNSYAVNFLLYSNWVALQKDLALIDKELKDSWQKKLKAPEDIESRIPMTSNKPDVDVIFKKTMVPVVSC